MILMQINNLVKRYGAELILSNIKVEIQSNDRIAIVGRNGAGKSTLLKIMAGQLSYDEGTIHQPKDSTLGYLAQNTGLESSQTIWEEMLGVFQHLVNKEKELREMELKMGDPAIMNDTATHEQLLVNYDQKQQAFKVEGGYHYEADIRAVLNGLHFQNHDLDTPINELSGGQKTRLALGKLLLSKPDMLILDEPTNHLDIETLTWLEGYLNNYSGAVIIVSHDRYFLDKTVNIVYEISRNKSAKFHGNYSKYLEKKAANYEQDMKQFEKQQSEIKRMEDFVQKNIVRASTTKRAQSRRKQLEKIDKLDRPSGNEASAKFSFDIQKRSGNDVLKVQDAAFKYEDGEDYIFSNLNFNVSRGDRIALVGPNGVGKTTLLKTIIGDHQVSKGTIQIGTNVQTGYYDQEQANLNSSKTVLLELWDDYPTMNEKDIRTVLGNFLFSGDDVQKPVSALSGGEKARLSLAKLMMEKSNLLILDEPTNHLDLDSKEILEAALMEFPGTILFVSHDRYFINKIATQIVEMLPQQTHVYLGDYDYYLDKKQEALELEELNKQENKVVDNANPVKSNFEQDKEEKKERRKRERRIQEVEIEIEQIEQTIEEIEDLLCKPEVFQDHEKALELTEKNEKNNHQLETLMEEWEELHE
ncbi:ABC-F family ATP-binding cassette domain-containing protein [Aquibacillus rhizosphaerae]|uniref:ABC-F family ATP-binding cassette domain-containing protein n=1 Tax=Aquibacillus rhizosphaerae TaxID=3051431 RepID=A0ABT7L7W4_9BACI|nr:ABC-F family ATP-binding cassette domain-containing protein [Aquibacillus sp. LR5S19]MDL4841952.1 ABC-F family ATP-binding cassette domain-containing protein [Aquibacillus sp. LR5S19]